MGGGTEIFQLLAGKDIDGDEMDLGVTVLSGLGGAHFNDLARAALDNNEAVFAERRALHRIGERGASISALEGVLMLSKMSQSKLAQRHALHKTLERGGSAVVRKTLTWASSAMMKRTKEVDDGRSIERFECEF